MNRPLRKWEVENMLAAQYTPPETLERMLRRRRYGQLLKLMIGVVLIAASLIGAWVFVTWQFSATLAFFTCVVIGHDRWTAKRKRKN